MHFMRFSKLERVAPDGGVSIVGVSSASSLSGGRQFAYDAVSSPVHHQVRVWPAVLVVVAPDAPDALALSA